MQIIDEALKSGGFSAAERRQIYRRYVEELFARMAQRSAGTPAKSRMRPG
ncbi:MAG: hypothetical protein ACOY0T_37795 [Myxococcota bacterium]